MGPPTDSCPPPLRAQVLIPAPYWVSYPEMARLAGATPRVLDCAAAEGYLLTAGQLRGALTPASRLLILCTPSNPTGAVYPLARLQVACKSPLALNSQPT